MKEKQEHKNKILKTFTATVKNVDPKNYTVEALISNDTKDRDGEIILKTAWVNGLADYLKHPILLSSHRYDKLTNQIGKATDLKMTDEGLVAIFQYFVNEGNPEADWAFNLASKNIAAYSVGFIGNNWIDGDYEKGIGRIFTDVYLLEVSQVLIPSNPDALQRDSKDPIEKELVDLAIKAFNWDKKDDQAVVVNPSDPESQVTPEVPETGLPLVYSLEEHKNMIADCMRAVLKEHMVDIQSCIRDAVTSCFNNMPKKDAHYMSVLFKHKGQDPIGSNESINKATDEFVKKLKEKMQIK